MHRRPRTVHLREHARLAEPLPGLDLQAVSVGHAGEALAVWRSSGLLLGASYDPQCDVVLRSQAHLPEVRFIQPAGDGRFIVVEGWSGSEGNGWVLGSDGEVLHEANVGGHVAQVRSTTSGDVWVGYSDMGVFDSGPAADLSSCGLVRFSSLLHPQWRFPNSAGPVRIDDCEGINVSGDTVWMCPFYKSPVARIRDDTMTVWQTPDARENIGAILVDEPTARVGLVANRWSHQPGLTALGALGEGTFEPQESVVIGLPDGRTIPPEAQLVAQGPDLHVFIGHDWYRTDLGRLGGSDDG